MTAEPLASPPQAPAEPVDVTWLAPAQRAQVGVIAAGAAGGAAASFGAGPLRKRSGLLDQMLTGLRAEDNGQAGALLAELSTVVATLDTLAMLREAAGNAPLLARLPLLARRYSVLHRFRAEHGAITAQLAGIAGRANALLSTVAAKDATLDRLLGAADNTLGALLAWIAGGQLAVRRMRADGASAPGAAPLDTRLARLHATHAQGALCIAQVRTAQQAGGATCWRPWA